MALKATIFKADLQIADTDRGYYRDHALTLARHPSETDERMMLRLLAFALNADETLAFGNGLTSDDEPDLWQKDLTGAIDLWIDVGLPDEKRIPQGLRPCGASPRIQLRRPRRRHLVGADRRQGRAVVQPDGSQPAFSRYANAGQARATHDGASMQRAGRPRLAHRRGAHCRSYVADAESTRRRLTQDTRRGLK